ncbi:Hypothetical protein, putative [Bodo saltans]|uniref:Uncharacterized protein n=1 Tax=Bodo saltans TaxID=75058 RepID=A0A0S4J180_BODSA|nr:Hypothetical protein, putative [Bodo saltans]|eukprot:CUG48206.1 Hypothetical protein, putative [Bodo saltans]
MPCVVIMLSPLQRNKGNNDGADGTNEGPATYTACLRSSGEVPDAALVQQSDCFWIVRGSPLPPSAADYSSNASHHCARCRAASEHPRPEMREQRTTSSPTTSVSPAHGTVHRHPRSHERMPEGARTIQGIRGRIVYWLFSSQC